MKNRKRDFALSFDEASSSSEADSSSDEESSASESSIQNNNNDDQSEDDGESLGGNDSDRDGTANSSQSNSDVESDDDDDNDSDDDLPLHERVQKREERGLSLQKVREKKSRALEVASERLAKMKQSKLGKVEDDNEPKKKKSKHAPTEVSSRRGDFFRRGAPKLNESGIGVEIGAHKYKPLDPRTSNLSGHLNEEQYEKNYAFLDEIRNKEISRLKKQIAARKQTGKKGKKMRRKMDIKDGSLEEDQTELKRLQQEKAEMKRRILDRAAKQAVKIRMREGVAEGKRGVYFLKRKDQRRMHLEAKLEEIRKRGGDGAVEKAVAKRRQKKQISRCWSLFEINDVKSRLHRISTPNDKMEQDRCIMKALRNLF